MPSRVTNASSSDTSSRDRRSCRVGWLRAAGICLVSSILLHAQVGVAQLPGTSDDVVVERTSSAYLLSFASKLRGNSGRVGVRICILGASSLADSAQELLSVLTPRQRAGLQIDEVTAGSSFQSCGLLFIGRSLWQEVDTLLREAPSNVLTISEIPGFLRRGGMVQLKPQELGIGYALASPAYSAMRGVPASLIATQRCTVQQSRASAGAARGIELAKQRGSCLEGILLGVSS